MRTITEKVAYRLLTQAKEAELQGLKKVAKHCTNAVAVHGVRKNDASYTYAIEDFHTDVEGRLWEGVVRAVDFFDCRVDASEMNDIVMKLAEQLIKEVRIKGGAAHGVGAYEPNVPGECRETISIEIEEE
ncbi:MAG: hypothetical protein Q8P20_00590 [bacterium]|nr:hypothetical protein [bacterium]